MKFKYYLRGIGIGVVITTIIFMILISIHKNDEKLQDASEKDAESKTVAALEEDTQKAVQTSPEPDARPSKPKEEAKKDTKKDTEKNEKTDTLNQPETETQEKESKPNSSDKVRFEISGGEFSDTVCRKLKEEGLIDDAAAFNQFLVEKGYDNSILPGVYDIPRDSTYEEIAVLLTAKVE